VTETYLSFFTLIMRIVVQRQYSFSDLVSNCYQSVLRSDIIAYLVCVVVRIYHLWLSLLRLHV
jgi:hypothetical protein